MIESRYWRSELRSDLAWLKRHQTYRRWSEKQAVLFERKLMLAAFQVRSLLERPKVNDFARNTKVPVLRHKKIGSRPFTVMGSGWPHERFDMANPEHSELAALDVCNQLIHYYWMQTYTEGRSFKGMLVFSDYARHKWAYDIQVDALLSLFGVFAEDASAVFGLESEWCDRRQDFRIVRALGPGDLRK